MNNGPERTQFASGAEDELVPARMEEALRQALEHRHPPLDFAERVLARAQAGAEPRPMRRDAPGRLLHWPQRRLWVSGAIAAALVAGLFEGEATLRRMREQERRVAEATAQFQATERITVHALAQARQQLEKAGVPLD